MIPAGSLHLRCWKNTTTVSAGRLHVYDASRKTSRLRCQQEDLTLTMPAGRLRLRCQQEDYVYDACKKNTLTISAGRIRLQCKQEDYVYDACGRKTMLMSPTRQLLADLHRKTSPGDLITITKVFLQSEILSKETIQSAHRHPHTSITIY